MTILQFNTKVHFGHNERQRLIEELRTLSVHRPLFVSDKGVCQAGVFDLATESLDKSEPLTLFDDVPANPTEAASQKGLEMFLSSKCDGIVGIGGGATMDLAKAIAVLAGDPAPLWEYCNRNSKTRPIKNPPPLILMPTTSGSGSEVGRSAVIIFDNGIKAGVGCPTIVKAAICDPDLTLGLPSRVTAATGMDALSHCIETYCSPTINPPADAIALDGLKRLHANIEAVTKDGRNAQARWHMMMGALEGAVCFQKGMGGVHSLSHALGAYGFHHGTLNALFLPHILRYNREALGDKYESMCLTMDLPADCDLYEHFRNLNERLGLPNHLLDMGVDAVILEAVADAALLDNAHKTNPRPLAKEDYQKILSEAY